MPSSVNLEDKDQNMLKQLNKIEAQIKILETSLRDIKSVVTDLKKDQEVDYKEVEGVLGKFDGKYMIADEDGQKYEVPSNYAAKTKLLHGDILKMLKEKNRNFFKHVKKQKARVIKGIISKKEDGWYILADCGSYRISDDAASFNKVEVNDEAEALIPEDNVSVPFAALSRVLKDAKKQEVKQEKSGEVSVNAVSTVKSAEKKEQEVKKPEVAKPALEKPKEKPAEVTVEKSPEVVIPVPKAPPAQTVQKKVLASTVQATKKASVVKKPDEKAPQQEKKEQKESDSSNSNDMDDDDLR